MAGALHILSPARTDVKCSSLSLSLFFGISQAHGFESLLEAEDSPSLGAEATVGRVTLWQDAFNEWMLSACEKYGKALAQSSPVLSCSCMPGPFHRLFLAGHP